MSNTVVLGPSLEDDLASIAASDWSVSLYTVDGTDLGEHQSIPTPPCYTTIRFVKIPKRSKVAGFSVWRDDKVVATGPFDNGHVEYFPFARGEIVLQANITY